MLILSGLLLVTGATGFLGGAVIASLIRGARWPSVLLLARGAKALAAMMRPAETAFAGPVAV